MPIRKLRKIDGSGYVALPKGDLERDGLVDEHGELESVPCAVDREGPGEYRLTLIDE